MLEWLDACKGIGGPHHRLVDTMELHPLLSSSNQPACAQLAISITDRGIMANEFASHRMLTIVRLEGGR